MKDEYLSVEHVFLGIASKPNAHVKEILTRMGYDEKKFLKELSVEVEHYKAHRSLTSGVIGTVVCKQVGKADPRGGYCLLPTRDLLALLDGLDPLDL